MARSVNSIQLTWIGAGHKIFGNGTLIWMFFSLSWSFCNLSIFSVWRWHNAACSPRSRLQTETHWLIDWGNTDINNAIDMGWISKLDSQVRDWVPHWIINEWRGFWRRGFLCRDQTALNLLFYRYEICLTPRLKRVKYLLTQLNRELQACLPR